MDTINLEDHIDTPIKKSVVGLSLLGFNPVFSCCGFTYQNEKVKKDHLDRPYVYLYYTSMTAAEKELLLQLCSETGWTLSFVAPNMINLQGGEFDETHPWKKKDSPHCYEMAALTIQKLEVMIDNKKNKFRASSIITDGNKIYKEYFKVKHWQYPVSDDWTVTPEIYEKL